MEGKVNSKKQKSDMRWEAGRHIHADVLPSLETSGQAAVLMFCWFHARGLDSKFDCSAAQIAHGTKLSAAHVKRILRRLEKGGVLKTSTKGGGRGNPSIRFFTGRQFDVEAEARAKEGDDDKRARQCSPLENKRVRQTHEKGAPESLKGSAGAPHTEQNKESPFSLRDTTLFADEKKGPDERPGEDAA